MIIIFKKSNDFGICNRCFMGVWKQSTCINWLVNNVNIKCFTYLPALLFAGWLVVIQRNTVFVLIGQSGIFLEDNYDI